MKAVTTMVVASAAVWLGVVLASPDHALSVFFGILGPLAVVAGTWLLIERVARQNPAALTSLMMTGFVVKMVVFAFYVVAVIRLARVDWTVFTISFTMSFIALYAVEAVLLRRLMARLT